MYPSQFLRQQVKMAFKLDLPPFMKLHSVVNCEYLLLYEPSMPDEDKEQALPSL